MYYGSHLRVMRTDCHYCVIWVEVVTGLIGIHLYSLPLQGSHWPCGAQTPSRSRHIITYLKNLDSHFRMQIITLSRPIRHRFQKATNVVGYTFPYPCGVYARIMTNSSTPTLINTYPSHHHNQLDSDSSIIVSPVSVPPNHLKADSPRGITWTIGLTLTKCNYTIKTLMCGACQLLSHKCRSKRGTPCTTPPPPLPPHSPMTGCLSPISYVLQIPSLLSNITWPPVPQLEPTAQYCEAAILKWTQRVSEYHVD